MLGDVKGETAAEFRARVEEYYKYEIGPGENWCLFGDWLIVAHPERQPVKVHEGGRIEKIDFATGPWTLEPPKYFIQAS